MRRAPAGRGQNAALLRYGRMLVEIVLVLLAAWLCVRLVFAIITPVNTAGTPVGAVNAEIAGASSVATDLTVLERFDPFTARPLQSVNEDTAVQVVVESTLNLKLKGVWSWGESGSAIVDTGEGVETFVVGDEIQSGVILSRVMGDRVIISRNGIDEALFLETRDGVRRAPTQEEQPQPAPVTEVNQANVARLTEIIDIRPLRDASGGGQMWQLQPGRDAAAFAALGLMPGDILSSVNGRRVPSEPERLIDMMAEMANGKTVTFSVLRQGREVTLSFSPSTKE